MAKAELNFLDPTETATLQLEAIKAIGEFKLSIARAELTRALANREQAKVDGIRVAIRQLERAMRDFVSEQAQYRRQIKKWESMALQLSLVQDAEAITRNGLTRMWQAYTFFNRLTTSDVNNEIDETAVSAADRKKANYVAFVAGRREPLSEDVPAERDNLSLLIGWLKNESRNVIPRLGTKPFRMLRDALLKIAARRARDEIENLRCLMEGIEKRTLSAWQPIMLAPFLESAAIDKILNVKPTAAS